MAFLDALTAVPAAALNLIVPPLCLSCRKPITEPRNLCADCWRDLGLISRPICDITGAPLAFDAGPGARSPELRWNHPLYDKARAATVFSDTSRRLVHALKFHDTPGVAPLMARLMAPAIADLAEEADVIVPVPLHRSRLAARKFNQAVAIADALSPLVGKPVDRFSLARIRATAKQSGLRHTDRADNLDRAFAVTAPDKIRGKSVLVVDDVLTSGATADAIALALKGAGASLVYVAVFAKVVGGAAEPV